MSTSASHFTHMDDPYNAPFHGCSGCATTAGRRGCPQHGVPVRTEAGVRAMVALNDLVEAQRLCRLGYHAWLPWLAISNDDGLVLHYVTYCSRCKHEEQYDL